jgi:hypothetical protein
MNLCFALASCLHSMFQTRIWCNSPNIFCLFAQAICQDRLQHVPFKTDLAERVAQLQNYIERKSGQTDRQASSIFIKFSFYGQHLQFLCRPESESESESLYNWRSISQYVLVSSPIWDFWPEICILFFFLNYSLVLFGAPSLTRGRVCHLSVYSSQSLFT